VYTPSETFHNGKPVWVRGGYSLYQRDNGVWYLDFNAVDDTWAGTVHCGHGETVPSAASNCASPVDWPWEALWDTSGPDGGSLAVKALDQVWTSQSPPPPPLRNSYYSVSTV